MKKSLWFIHLLTPDFYFWGKKRQETAESDPYRMRYTNTIYNLIFEICLYIATSKSQGLWYNEESSLKTLTRGKIENTSVLWDGNIKGWGGLDPRLNHLLVLLSIGRPGDILFRRKQWCLVKLVKVVKPINLVNQLVRNCSDPEYLYNKLGIGQNETWGRHGSRGRMPCWGQTPPRWSHMQVFSTSPGWCWLHLWKVFFLSTSSGIRPASARVRTSQMRT